MISSCLTPRAVISWGAAPGASSGLATMSLCRWPRWTVSRSRWIFVSSEALRRDPDPANRNKPPHESQPRPLRRDDGANQHPHERGPLVQIADAGEGDGADLTIGFQMGRYRTDRSP